MNKNKKLKNRKRYLGNPFTVAFLPVLASVGLTLGATSLTLKNTGMDEQNKPHPIDIVDPTEPEQKDWKVVSNKTQAKRGDKVTFKAIHRTQNPNTPTTPIGVNVNSTLYTFDEDLQVTVTIPFVEKMTVTMAFPQPKTTFDVTFNPNHDEQPSSTIKVVQGETVAKPLDPVYKDHIFDGWFESGAQESFNFNTPIMAPVELFAHWSDGPTIVEHSIDITQPSTEWEFQFENKTRSVTSPAARLGDEVVFSVNHRDSVANSDFPYAIKLTPIDNPENEITIPLNKSSWTSYSVTTTIPFSQNMRAEVVFQPAQTVVVTFDNGGAPSIIDSQVIQAGDIATKPSATTWPGHTFKYWYKENESKEYSFNSVVLTNITLHAKWNVDKYSIKFEDENGEELQAAKEFEYGSMPVYSKALPHKDPDFQYSYLFKNWKNKTTGVEGIVQVTEQATYVPVYEKTVNKYSVTYDTDGGTYIAPSIVEYGATLTKPTIQKDGCKDPYWYYVDAGGVEHQWIFNEDPGESTVVQNNVALKVRWTDETYKVNYLNSNGAKLQDEKTVKYNEVATYDGKTPTHPTESEKYVFNGWDKPIEPIKADTTYTAQYKSPTAQNRVKFNSMCGIDIPEQLIDNNGTIATAPKPERIGYTLDGWYNGTEKFVFADEPGTPTKVTTDLMLKAQWTPLNKTIVFLNYDGSELETKQVPYGSVPVYSGTTPTKPDDESGQYSYAFKGWDKPLAKVTDNASYTAVFVPILKSYTVTFNTNGAEEYKEAVKAEYGSGIKKPTGTMTKTGYDFAGWYKDDGTWAQQWVFTDDAGTPTQVTGDITLYAKWTPKTYTVTFYNGDGTTYDTQNVEYGQTPSDPSTTKSQKPTKVVQGYTCTFKRWDKQLTPVTGNISYAPVFEETPTILLVTFDTDGGTLIAPQAVKYGDKISTTATPTWTDYTFQNQWCSDEDCTTVFDDAVTKNMTLYAKWQHNSFDFSKDGTGWSAKLRVTPTTTTSYTIPSTAFRGKSVVSLTKDAFTNKKINGLTIPSTVKKIYGDETESATEGAFTGTQIVDLPNIFGNETTVETIGPLAFSKCDYLGKQETDPGQIYIPRGIKKFESIHSENIRMEGTFNGCSNIKKVYVDDDRNNGMVCSNYMFSNCTGLLQVNLPKDITAFGAYMFLGCNNLMEVYCWLTRDELDTLTEAQGDWFTGLPVGAKIYGTEDGHAELWLEIKY